MKEIALQQTLDKLKEVVGYERLERREKLIISIGGVILLCLGIFHFVVSPLIASRVQLQRVLVDKQSALEKMVGLQKEYGEVANKLGGIAERIAERQKEFTLFSFLERQATTAEVKEKVKYMKPSEEDGDGILRTSVVEMKLVEISLVQLVDFLKLVESTVDVVSVGRISIQENVQSDEGFLDVVMQIQTFVNKE